MGCTISIALSLMSVISVTALHGISDTTGKAAEGDQDYSKLFHTVLSLPAKMRRTD
jgi:hypothetical protein